jgi:hypothetical protein
MDDSTPGQLSARLFICLGFAQLVERKAYAESERARAMSVRTPIPVPPEAT